MEAELMLPGAIFNAVFLMVSSALLYMAIGALIAMARWKAWETKGDTLAKTLIAPVASLDRGVPYIQNSEAYHVLIAVIWPAVVTWNIFTLCVLLIWLGMVGAASLAKTAGLHLKRAVDAVPLVRTTGWRLKQVARRAVRFVTASPETRTRWKIQQLLSQSRRLYGNIARDRIRVDAANAKLNALIDSLPAQESPGGPFRSVKLRAVS